MNRILHFLDKIAVLFIVFYSLGNMLHSCGFGIWVLPLQDYDISLQIAERSINKIFAFLGVMGFLLLLKNKHPFLQKIEMLLWICAFLLIPYWLHLIPSVDQAYFQNSETIQRGINE